MPGQGTKILHAWHGQKQEKKEIERPLWVRLMDKTQDTQLNLKFKWTTNDYLV